jgi:DNA (cytosine-5)-methyltransferase 1
MKVKLWESDIRHLRSEAIMAALNLRPGELDLVAACPPCQGFSTMRTRNGTQQNRDERNDLVIDVLRFVRSMAPTSIMLENVPGLAKDKRYSVFLKELESLGYLITWNVLNTVDFGVPQSRRRLILLASKLGLPRFAPPEPRYRTVRQTIGGLTPPDRSRDPLHNYPSTRSEKVEALIRTIPHNGGSRKALGPDAQLACHKRVDGFNDVYGRMAWDKPAPTITGGCISPSKGRFLHPSADRAITLREAALLQTFPKTYRFCLVKGRYSVALMIGNALPPAFIFRHALALRNLAVQIDR